MPLYEVTHGLPLSREQKDAFAEYITHLHSTTFVTPRLFVNVAFHHPTVPGDVYMGGKFKGAFIPNVISGTIRTSAARTKDQFDDIAVKLQNKWNELANDASLGAVSIPGLSEKQEKAFKKLHGVVFSPLVSALEKGIPVSEAGQEGVWLKENMSYFQEQAENGDEDVRDMLKELDEREDLRKLLDAKL